MGTATHDALALSALEQAQLVRAGEVSARELVERALAGVPIGLKDLQLSAGLRTTFGSRAAAEFVPEQDAAAVRRLREAGAVAIGKTNAPELGILPVTEPEHHGPARNP